MNVKEVLRAMIQLRSSDLFLKVGGPPRVRVDGTIRQLGNTPMTKEDMKDAFMLLVDEHSREGFKKAHECDTAYEEEDIGRFRVNCFMQRGNIGFVLRHVRSDIPDFKDLGLPVETFERLAMLRRGLVLVTGITGSGKSTTLASMIEYMNRNTNRHIITVEDPIEYSYVDDRCVINQREVGIDTRDFKSALKNAMRDLPTSSWSVRCVTSKPSTPPSTRPKPATWCSRRCTPSTRNRRWNASSTSSRLISTTWCACNCRWSSRASSANA